MLHLAVGLKFIVIKQTLFVKKEKNQIVFRQLHFEQAFAMFG